MAETSKIEWTDATWNPITGCSVVSPGCTNCYAMKLAGGRLRNHPSRAGLTEPSKAGPVWNGKIRFNTSWLDQPLHWHRPRMVFVVAHGDLFYEKVRYEWIDHVFAVMARAPHHIFQVLTKRPERMRAYLSDGLRNKHVAGVMRYADPKSDYRSVDLEQRWPLPNVWLGTSIEDRRRGQERAWHLANTPAAVRWWSVEPLLEDLGDLTQLCLFDTLDGERKAVDWVVVGGESGPGARCFRVEWARQIIAQCRRAQVPVFVKQLGSRPILDRDESDAFRIRDPKGGDWSEWPEDLRVREYPDMAA